MRPTMHQQKRKKRREKKCYYMIKKNPLKVKAKAVIRGMARDLFFCLWISSACHSETISSTFTSDFGLLLTKTAFTVVGNWCYPARELVSAARRCGGKVEGYRQAAEGRDKN